jgi:hypothetical protein
MDLTDKTSDTTREYSHTLHGPTAPLTILYTQRDRQTYKKKRPRYHDHCKDSNHRMNSSKISTSKIKERYIGTPKATTRIQKHCLTTRKFPPTNPIIPIIAANPKSSHSKY